MSGIRKGVITAAGRGTRLAPATRTVQKELFPLVDVDGQAKPVIQILAEELRAAGVEEICVVANAANAEPIRTHFAADPEGAGRVFVAVQQTQDGYGHAVFQAREWAGEDPFVLTLGDHVYFSDTDVRCARQVMDACTAHGCSVSSVFAVAAQDAPRYGIIAGLPLAESSPTVYGIRAMAEKPTVEFARANLQTPGLADGQYLSFFGIHAFTPAIFDCLRHLIDNDIRQRSEIQLTAAQALLSERGPYVLTQVQGTRYDMGIPEGLIETQIALALRSPFAAQARAALKGDKS